MDENLNLRMRQGLVLVGGLIAAACVFILLSTIISIQTTGVVKINTSISQAVISVSQANHEAKIVGTGKVSIRLKPGTYQIKAGVGRDIAIKTVKIARNQENNVFLRLSEAPHIRSVEDIDFNGLSSFTSSGLSTDQLTTLQLAFFRYKTSAETVIIDGESLSPAPRDPATATFFATNFDVSIDDVSYKGVITYSGSNDLSLSLYDPQSNTLVFNSSAGAEQESD